MASFKRAPAPGNPYEAARQEWNERFGEYVHGAQMWRLVAFIALGLSALGFLFGLYQASKVKLVPYVVQVDQLGGVAYSGPAPSAEQTDPRIIKAFLVTFISNFRGVTPDTRLQENRINSLYSFLAKSDPATTRISRYFKDEGGDPFKRAGTETVQVQVNNVIPLPSDRTWQVDWLETTYSRTGEKLHDKRFKANLTISLTPPQDEAAIRINPIGMYVTNIEWNEAI